MSDPLAVDHEGNALTAFHPVAEGTRFDDGPLPLALVAVWHGERLLLVFNGRRRCWELPGGMIDPGETPRQAAVRELREETGIEVGALAFAGYARFLLGAERRVEYAAVYAATAVPGDGFGPNEEIGAIHWWNGVEALDGPLQPLDVMLGRLARKAIFGRR